MGTKRFKAAVIGGSGYGGAELIRRLLVHPDVELARVASIDFVGEPLSAVHPNLEGRTDLRFEGPRPRRSGARDGRRAPRPAPQGQRAQGARDHGDGRAHRGSLGRLSPARSRGVREVLRRRAPLPRELTGGTFVYGLPELNREAIRKARYVASPGCFATTIELALLPLATAGVLAGAVEVVGITGSSGSGVAPSAGTHHPVRANNLRTYKPLEHQHIPEIAQTLVGRGRARRDGALRPGERAARARHLRDVLRARRREPRRARRSRTLFRGRYAGEPFVRVPAKRLPEVVAVKGTNYAEVGVGRRRRRRAASASSPASPRPTT